MTEQSSCKRGFFGKYLRYRIGTLSGSLLICSTLNLLGLPFFALGHLFASSSQLHNTNADSNFFLYATFFGSACVYASILLAVTGAAFAFSYCNKKGLTDTLGVLPLTHRQRFWGDFLGGYIANVAPFIPAAFVSIILFSAALKNYGAYFGEDMGEYIRSIIGPALTLFFVYTFGYIISVLVTVIMGRFMFAEIFSAIGTVVFTLLISGVSGVILNGITGFSVNGEDMIYAMPFGPLFGEAGESLSAMGAFSGSIDITKFSIEFMILKPLNIVIFTVSAAVLITLSYYITKSRKQENVGKIVAHGAAFRTMALLTAAAAVMFAVANYGEYDIFPSFFVGAVIGAVIVTVFEIIRRPSSKEIFKTIAGYAGTLALCYGLCILVKATGAFGARYISTSPENVEYISVIADIKQNGEDKQAETCELTEKEDIQRFTDNHNSILKTYGDELESGSEFVLVYKLNDGTSLLRGYQRRESGSEEPFSKMLDNLHSLDGYPKALCKFMTDGSTINECSAAVEGVYGEIAVPLDNLSEFLGIFSSEMTEKYSPNAQNCGSVEVRFSNAGDDRLVNLFIQNDYTKTLEYLRALDSSAEDDEDTLALTLWLCCNSSSELSVCVYKKDLENKRIKELFSLLEQSSAFGAKPYTGQVSKKIIINSLNSINYYVPLNAEKRVMEIITEFAVSGLGQPR